MRDHSQTLRRRDVEDVDAVAGDREQPRAIGLHAVTLIHTRGLRGGLRVVGRTRGVAGNRCEGGADTPVHDPNRAAPPAADLPTQHGAPAGHRCLDRPRLQPAAVADRRQGVGDLVADEELALVEPRDVAAGGAIHRVDGQATIERVSACAGADRVNAGTAEERVIAAATHDRVDAAVAADLVVASTAVESVAARAAENHVGAIAPRDLVVAESPFEPRRDAIVARYVHRDRVVAEAGNNVN